MSEENRALVQRFFDEVWNQGREDLVPQYLAPDALFHSPLSPEPMRGPHPLQHFIHTLHDLFPDIHYDVHDLFAAGDRVAVRWRTRQTHTKPFMGVQPTGQEINFTGIEIMRIADGRIAEIWLETNIYGTLRQLGLAPPLQF